MHSIAVMAQKLRAKPGGYGLVTANGWYLTKQSTGIYSTKRPDVPFEREDPKVIQRQIDALPHPDVIEQPQGAGRIETYTVVHRREGPFMGIVVGRDANDRRFVAVTPNDPSTRSGFGGTPSLGPNGPNVGPSGGIAAVVSKSSAQSIKVFKNRRQYNQWVVTVEDVTPRRAAGTQQPGQNQNPNQPNTGGFGAPRPGMGGSTPTGRP